MPLFDGYGFLAGSLLRYGCDNRQDAWHYYHCSLLVRARGAVYRCVVDLDSKQRRDGIQWKVVELPHDRAAALRDHPDGWRFIGMDEESGALDYYRSEWLGPSAECVRAGCEEGASLHCWKYGTGNDAFRDLEPMLRRGRRIFVFGEPFRNGKGVHNIHQNQGDPPGSRWAAENGPWQDGAVMVERPDGSVAAFLCKFSTQRFCLAEAQA
ncbi:DUF2278 family protein [Chlorobaculum sp. 24CR]|uniref:DUF2278 family protein n=1 Tax=Chlorobaculum sp. 24CR TaxID=2508878 RepID=UPI00100A9626|nr:DUF2278 family protein [Chlorobaculum sp. 24CR]RXK85064.1 DUF2278 family protein [Chlorobaculum sp. 24CR]